LNAYPPGKRIVGLSKIVLACISATTYANTFTYSDKERMATASNAGGTVNYLYNALNLRVAKTGLAALIATGASYYVFDEAG
jgi:hypothetical protein